jgi:hypothetical protein
MFWLSFLGERSNNFFLKSKALFFVDLSSGATFYGKKARGFFEAALGTEIILFL